MNRRRTRETASWRRRHPLIVALGGVLLLNALGYVMVVVWLRAGMVAGMTVGILATVLVGAYSTWARPAFFDDDGTIRTT